MRHISFPKFLKTIKSTRMKKNGASFLIKDAHTAMTELDQEITTINNNVLQLRKTVDSLQITLKQEEKADCTSASQTGVGLTLTILMNDVVIHFILYIV